jgi:diguanylate cyclase (GGDEF)-like protein
MDALAKHTRISLAAKFNLLTIMLILAASVGVSIFMIRSEVKNYYRDLLNHGETIADTTARNCEYGIFTEDRESLYHIADGLSAASDIAYLAVLKEDGRVIVSKAFKQALIVPESPFGNMRETNGPAHLDFVNKQDGLRYTEILFPVVSNAGNGITDILLKNTPGQNKIKVIGYLRLGVSHESLKKRIRELLQSTILFTTFLVLLGSGLTVIMTKRITSPLNKLKSATQDISLGKFDSPIDLSTRDEISELARSFDDMRNNLKAYRGQVEERTSELTAANLQLVEEINARKLAEEQLKHDAFYDTLTGLPNRALFTDRLVHAIAIAKRRKDFFFAVLFLDLDRFKVINDSLGHLIGDQLLIALGQRLVNCLRPGDTVARLGGDEFAILLTDTSGLGNAVYIADRIKGELTAPFILAEHEVFASASIGIALNTAEYELPEQILRDADTAMYQAKVSGRSNYAVFEKGMHANAVERLRLETDLRKAIERKEILAYYQPIVSMKTRRIIGFEALARWQHPNRGLISPNDFVPIAEETGMIVSIDRLVLKDACLQMRAWQERLPGNPVEFISVNLSNKQMAQPDVVKHVAQVLSETGLMPKYLKLEITEGVVIENPEAISAMLSQLRALGVQLYIDDFGTGYSSLSYLHRLPINGLKIDRSFIRRMGANGENQEIIRTILLLARDLNVEVVAEGIETELQLEQIRALNCEYWQGYLFSKPVASKQAGAFIEGDAGLKEPG